MSESPETPTRIDVAAESFDSPESLEALEREFQTEITQGWSEFLGNAELVKKYRELVEINKDFYKLGLEKYIPYPPYQLAAQKIGAHMVKKAAKLGIAFDAVFPGNYEESVEEELTGPPQTLDQEIPTIPTEDTEDDHQVRHFQFQALKNCEPFAVIRVSFYHIHDGFDFPVAPVIKVSRPKKDSTATTSKM